MYVKGRTTVTGKMKQLLGQVIDVIKLFFAGNLENLDFPLFQKSKHMPFKKQ